MNRCPYCGLEDDWDPVKTKSAPFSQGDVLFCDGCGGVEIATGVLWETRPPTDADVEAIRPFTDAMRREHAIAMKRDQVAEYFARQLRPARQFGANSRDRGAPT